MEYTWHHVTGTETAEIPEEWAELLHTMDREEEANRKKETRRHCSLEHAEEDGYCLTDACTAETALIAGENRSEINAFLTSLTDTQRRRLLMYARGMSYREIARRESVDHKKVIKSISQARKKCMGGAPKVFSRVRINEGPNLHNPCSLQNNER